MALFANLTLQPSVPLQHFEQRLHSCEDKGVFGSIGLGEAS